MKAVSKWEGSWRGGGEGRWWCQCSSTLQHLGMKQLFYTWPLYINSLKEATHIFQLSIVPTTYHDTYHGGKCRANKGGGTFSVLLQNTQNLILMMFHCSHIVWKMFLAPSYSLFYEHSFNLIIKKLVEKWCPHPLHFACLGTFARSFPGW